MKLLIIGYGRMGKLVESLSSSYGFEVAGVLDIDNNQDGRGLASPPAADVAVDFSIAAATRQNLPLLARHRINAVIGTTGLGEDEEALRRVVSEAGIGVVVASNFSLGVNLFQNIVERAARQFAAHADYGAFIHEAHHAA
jgi:4-hydroxy-tetrahydrodipicolinate reductase